MESLLHVDHVIAVANGGTDDPANLVSACASCNLGKSAVPLDESRLQKGTTAGDAIEHAAQIRDYLKAQQEVEMAREEVYEHLCEYWRQSVGDDPPSDWYRRLRTLTRDYPMELIKECIDVVGNSGIRRATGQVKYFYGALRRRRTPAEVA